MQKANISKYNNRKYLDMLIILVLLAFLAGCHKSSITEADQERISSVKETLESFDLALVSEVTRDSAEEKGKNLDDVVSFGKHQVYEMSYLQIGDQNLQSVFYHKFADSSKGKDEAEALFLMLKQNYQVLPEGEVTEIFNVETGSRIYQLKYSFTDQNEKTLSGAKEISEPTVLYPKEDGELMSVTLIYNENRSEVGIVNEILAVTDDEIAKHVIENIGW